jgi:hypothetical protein
VKTTERTAQCACGETTMTVRGDPVKVLRCHCDYCQRRTGNVAQTSAWFNDDQVVTRSTAVTVVEYAEPSPAVNYMFCPTCGSTVFWTFDGFPGVWGVAVGNFFDSSFPMPSLEMFTEDRHPWIAPVPGAAHFPGMASLEALLSRD